VTGRTSYAAAAALVLALASPASAEPVRLAQAAPDVLPAHEILTIIRSTDLRPVGQPVRRGATYVLRAIDPSGEELRVVMDARHGDILSVRPAGAAAPPPGARMGAYGPPGGVYIERQPLPPGGYGPPAVYEGERPLRPPGTLPAPGRVTSAPPAPPPTGAPRGPAPEMPTAAPQDVATREADDTGVLPPPPERFPQRVAPGPAAKPAAPPRRAASAAPAQPPLPKPRPATPNAAELDASPLPPPIPLQPDDSVPH
jgi:hypothetical protein